MEHKLSPEVATKILDSLRRGVGRMDAANSAGVSARSMRRWMLLGQEDPQSHLGMFRSAVLEAEGNHKAEHPRTKHIGPEVQAELTKVLRLGNFRVSAARYAGVTPRSLKRWMQLGKSRHGSEYESFRSAVLKAEQDAEVGCVAQVILGARDDPRHAEWWLIRRHGDKWNPGGPPDAQAPEPAQGEFVEGISPEDMADPELRRRLDAVEERILELHAARIQTPSV
jgi:hypothetical protein